MLKSWPMHLLLLGWTILMNYQDVQIILWEASSSKSKTPWPLFCQELARDIPPVLPSLHWQPIKPTRFWNPQNSMSSLKLLSQNQWQCNICQWTHVAKRNMGYFFILSRNSAIWWLSVIWEWDSHQLLCSSLPDYPLWSNEPVFAFVWNEPHLILECTNNCDIMVIALGHQWTSELRCVLCFEYKWRIS